MASILLVDNDEDFLKARKAALEKDGRSVISAKSIEDAREKLKQDKQINLAVIDVRLRDDSDENDFSGLVLARELDIEIPVILCSGYFRNEDIRELFEEGRKIDFVSKDIEPLFAAIRKALERQRTEARSARWAEEKIFSSNLGAVLLLILAGITGAFAIFAGSLTALVLTFFLITFGLIVYVRSMAAKS